MNSTESKPAKFSKTFINAAAIRADIDSKDDGDEIRRLLPAVEALNNRRAIAVMYRNPYHSQPDFNVIEGDENVRAPYRDKYRPEQILVFRVARRMVCTTVLKEPTKYCGSFVARRKGRDVVVCLVDVFETAVDGKFWLRPNIKTNWRNSQEWEQLVKYDVRRFELDTGNEGVMKEHNDEMDRRIANRDQKFKNLSGLVVENFGEEVLGIIAKRKGKTLATLEVVATAVVSVDDLKKVLAVATEPTVISNMLTLIEREIPRSRAQQAGRGHAWSHIQNVLSGITFNGNFSEASESIRLYAENF